MPKQEEIQIKPQLEREKPHEEKVEKPEARITTFEKLRQFGRRVIEKIRGKSKEVITSGEEVAEQSIKGTGAESELVEEVRKETDTGKQLEETRGEIKELSQKTEEEVKEATGEKPVEKEIEKQKLKLEGEKIYLQEFVEKLDKVLNHDFKIEGKEKAVKLKDTLNAFLEKFDSEEFLKSSIEQQSEAQKEFVQKLVSQISKIPADTWSFYFDKSVETGHLNCSGCASLLGLILEKYKSQSLMGNVEFASPYGHSMNIVTFKDGSIYYADARNNAFEDISDNYEIEEEDGLKVYKIKELKGGVNYKLIPSLSVKDGVLNSYLENLESVRDASEGKFDEILKKTSTKEQLKTLEEEAKQICGERGLSDSQLTKNSKIRDIYASKLEDYQGSDEFKKEGERFHKAPEFEAGLRPVGELFGEDEKVREEILERKSDITSFLLFETDEIDLQNKEVEQTLKAFRENEKMVRATNRKGYEANVKKILDKFK